MRCQHEPDVEQPTKFQLVIRRPFISGITVSLLAEPLSAGVLFDPLNPAQTDQLDHELAAPAAVPVVTQSKAERFGGPRGERSAI